uniref:guanylate cyclase n=1 Tax=Acrobeloides nanus TaxID=290746 RepID=A0A914D8H8_9BILA
MQSLLWAAPEIIRSNNIQGTKAGDIYSLAIIASEIVTKRAVWNITDSLISEEEIVYRVKKGGFNPPRPALIIDPTLELNSSILHLIRDCWTEEPEQRPRIETVRSLLRAMQNGQSNNLMNNVFTMLEQYANNLEQEVEERTKELMEEKKKSDILLYRMLPKAVADKLKLGQVVEPEAYEQVTVFFSDVVSFTSLASRCTPLQVVNLLNDLYTMFDTIIEEHGVYKAGPNPSESRPVPSSGHVPVRPGPILDPSRMNEPLRPNGPGTGWIWAGLAIRTQTWIDYYVIAIYK